MLPSSFIDHGNCCEHKSPFGATGVGEKFETLDQLDRAGSAGRAGSELDRAGSSWSGFSQENIVVDKNVMRCLFKHNEI